MRTTRRLAALAVAAFVCACATPRGEARPPAEALLTPAAERFRVPELGAPPELRLPLQRKFELSNGLKVRLVEYRRLPIVALHLVLLEGGAVRDPPGRFGEASFTAAMVTEGTRTRSATQLSDELGFIGATLSAGASMDAAYVTGYSLSRHLPKLVELLADVTEAPAFPPSDFARVQDQRKVALLQQRDQPGAVASKAFGPLYWGSHPYGHWIMGTEASVAATTPEDLARFHAEHWRPGASELVVVGDVDEASLRPMLEKAFAGWTGKSPAQPVAAESEAANLRAVFVEKPAAPQTFLILGMPGMARSDPDFVAAQVLFQVLGGGSSSRLFRDLREEKGYTYGLTSRESAQKLGGVSYLGGSVRADATAQAVRDLLSEVEALRNTPVPQAELRDAQDSIALALPGEFATAAGIAGKLAEQVVYGLPDGWWGLYAAAVRAQTPADLQQVARRYLDPARLVTVLVGDKAVVQPQLAGLPLGPVDIRASPATDPR
jgi:predicted Zn-dependent peptidase